MIQPFDTTHQWSSDYRLYSMVFDTLKKDFACGSMLALKTNWSPAISYKWNFWDKFNNMHILTFCCFMKIHNSINKRITLFNLDWLGIMFKSILYWKNCTQFSVFKYVTSFFKIKRTSIISRSSEVNMQ